MLRIAKEAADRAVALIARAARDMAVSPEELLDDLESLGGLSNLVICLGSVAPAFEQNAPFYGIVKWTRELVQVGRDRQIPPEFADVEVVPAMEAAVRSHVSTERVHQAFDLIPRLWSGSGLTRGEAERAAVNHVLAGDYLLHFADAVRKGDA